MVDLNDIIGTKIERWYIESRAPNRGNKIYYNCICECGTRREVQRFQLLHGLSRSCGCLSAELAKKRIKHGCKRTRLYHTWVQMKDRCNNPNCKQYKYYGGRGIKICDEWNDDFIAFQTWSHNNGYRDDLTIDRIDNNGNYSPKNCRWVDNCVQQNNKRNNHYITIGDTTKTLTEWSNIYCINKHVVINRINDLGWDPIDAFTTPVKSIQRNRLYEYNGESKTLKQWAKDKNINYQTLYGRIHHYGLDIGKALCVGDYS